MKSLLIASLLMTAMPILKANVISYDPVTGIMVVDQFGSPISLNPKKQSPICSALEKEKNLKELPLAKNDSKKD